MRTKPLFKKNSNIEQYAILRPAECGVNWVELDNCTHPVCAKIDAVITLAQAKGLKHPYLRFMYGKGIDQFMFYTNFKAKTPKHLDGWYTYESITEYLNNL